MPSTPPTHPKVEMLRDQENRLAAIELSFPDSELGLLSRVEEGGDEASDAAQAAKKKMLRKRLSAPGSLFKLGIKRSHSRERVLDAPDPDMPMFSRYLIRDGPITAVKSEPSLKRRHVYLISDQMLVGRPRNHGSHTLKARLRLKYAWIDSSPTVPGIPEQVRGVVGRREVLVVGGGGGVATVCVRKERRRTRMRCFDKERGKSTEKGGKITQRGPRRATLPNGSSTTHTLGLQDVGHCFLVGHPRQRRLVFLCDSFEEKQAWVDDISE